MIGTGESILRTDTKGRLQTPPGRREKLLQEFEHSGLSGAKFAALAGDQVSDLRCVGNSAAQTTGIS
jgi:hypothetical protein